MPTAGDEGYEKLVICPYDKSHEIRRGRMQFHLEKCRRNFPTSQLVDCPYNKGHLVPKQELNYHMEEECDSRAVWERFSHEREEKIPCPVKDLVPVNAASVPDGGENWDDYEAVGSVLSHIKTEAEEKPIYRMLQVASKSKRKAFRAQERERYKHVDKTGSFKPKQREMSDTASVVSNPVHKTLKPSNLPVVRQQVSTALETMNKQLKTLDINKPPQGDTAPSEASFISSPSDYETASTSRQTPFYYAQASGSSYTGQASRPSSSMSSSSMKTALSPVWPHHSTPSRSATSMSNASSTSYITASQGESANRPPSAMSNLSVGSSSSSSMSAQRPPNSSTYRKNTAMNIATSAASYNKANPVDEDGFCQIPIPGLGRGKRRQLQ